MLDGVPVVREAFPKTVRLVSSARLRPPVLEALVTPDYVETLAEIEGATSARLMAEARGTEGVGREEHPPAPTELSVSPRFWRFLVHQANIGKSETAP